MVYAERPIIGHGDATPAQLRAAIVQRGQNLAPEYAPDHTYAPPPDGIETIIIEECNRYPEHPVNADGVTCQSNVETAGWQSAFARERNNPGGIGAEDDNPDEAYVFDTPREAFRAHVAHLLDYAVGRGPWTADDPRAKNMPEAWFGSCRTWADLQGKWATSPTYAASIEACWTALARIIASSDATGGAVSVPKPAMVSVSGITNFGGYAGTRRIDAIVEHCTDDDHLDGTLSWFKNPTSKASANVVIDFDGTIYECVPKEQSAWTNGVVDAPDPSNPLIANWLREGVSFSQRTYTVERVGKRGTHPTDAQLASMVKVAAWVASEEGFPIDRTHIMGHNQIDSVNRSYCPSLTEAEFARIIDGARALAVGGVVIPPAPDALIQPNNPYGAVPIVLGFRGYLEALAAARYPQDATAAILSIVGYAVAPEFATKDGAAQEFERGVLLYDKHASPPWDIVFARREDGIPEAA